jgi:hypothetical protein
MKFKDGYGNNMDRTGVCKNSNSVVVRITDTCPCYVSKGVTLSVAGCPVSHQLTPATSL